MQKHCGTCIRGSMPRKENGLCQKCWDIELKGGDKFTQWEKKENT